MSIPRDRVSDDEDSCEQFSMSLEKPMFRQRCYTESETDLPTPNVDLSDLDLSDEEYEDAIGEDKERTDNFESHESRRSKIGIQAHHSGSIRPHTFGGGEKKRNWLTFGHASEPSQRVESRDELKVTKLRPPEHKKSFIDMISQRSGLNISYDTDKDDDDDDQQSQDSSESVEENEILEEVFKKNSISSLDSGRSSASFKTRRPMVCPLDSCWKFVPVSDLKTHFKLEHSKIPLQCLSCNETVSFFVESCSFGSPNVVINERIIIVMDSASNEDSGYFTLNITNQCFGESDILLVWVSEIKCNKIQYLYKIRASNNNNESGKVVSFFGPVSNHQDPLAVFQNNDGLVIPKTIYESFKDFANGFDVNITFFPGQECSLIEDVGDRRRLM